MCLSSRSRQELSNELLSIRLQNLASIQPRTSPPKIQISFPPRQFDFISVSHRCISLQRGAPEKVVLHRDCSKRSPQDQQAIRYHATTENARKLASDPLKESDILAAAAEKERSALLSSASLSKLRCDLSLCFFFNSLLIKSSARPRGRRASWPEPTISPGSFLHHDPRERRAE